LAPQAPHFLRQSAPVQAGIDTGLVAEILDAPLLDPTEADPAPEDPRIVPYGASVEGRVSNTHEALRYSLVARADDAPGTDTGDLGPVYLSTGPVTEDVTIQVRATRDFAAGVERKPDARMLATKLHLKVTADPAPSVSATPSIVDHGRGATVRVGP